MEATGGARDKSGAINWAPTAMVNAGWKSQITPIAPERACHLRPVSGHQRNRIARLPTEKSDRIISLMRIHYATTSQETTCSSPHLLTATLLSGIVSL